mgnify:CR=1 FL=1
MSQLVEKQILGEGIGLTWQEITYAALTAQAITETTELDNPQQAADSLLTITPTVVGIETFITDRVRARINKKGFAKMGQLGQNAMQRKKDEDGLTLLASGATTCEPGAGASLTSSYIAGASHNITSNATEPGPMPVAVVLHGVAIHDVQLEILSGLGTYPIPAGMSEQVFRGGFKGMIGDGNLYEDGNITISSTPDVRGAVFSKMGYLLVQGKSPWQDKRYEPQKGYGGWNVWLKDEYIYAERSAGNWAYGLLSDGTQPTS